jgi:hypothetical protein
LSIDLSDPIFGDLEAGRLGIGISGSTALWPYPVVDLPSRSLAREDKTSKR